MGTSASIYSKTIQAYCGGMATQFCNKLFRRWCGLRGQLGLGSDYIYANGNQHEIGAVLKTGYRYSELTPPSIQYSSGEGGKEMVSLYLRKKL